jgi:DNA invertase Pin-like site-specific DNA recombinase
MTKIAFYARISRNDGVQDVENQLHELRTWATRLGGDVVAEYVDQVSGVKNGDARPALQEALHASHERRHDVLLVWSLDRLSRGGVLALAGILERVQRSGVVLKSLRESWLDTSSPMIAELLVSIFAWIARQEREQLIARTKAGMARAKRRGVHVGRPRLEVDHERAVLAVQRAGSIRGAARLLGCNEGTVRNRLAAQGNPRAGRSDLLS